MTFSFAAIVRLALRTLRRYPFATLTVIAVVFAPLCWFELRQLHVPKDRTSANALLNVAWGKLAVVWLLTMLAAGGIAPLAQATAQQRPLRLAQQPWAIVRGLGRAIGPVALAGASIGLGMVLGVIPGLLLFTLLWPVGASVALQPQSVLSGFRTIGQAVRVRWRWLASLAVATVAVDIATTGALHVGLLHNLGPKLPPPMRQAVALFVELNLGRSLIVATMSALLCAATAALLTTMPNAGDGG